MASTGQTLILLNSHRHTKCPYEFQIPLNSQETKVKKLLAAFTALALSSAVPAASAQFTAAVVPPKKPKAEETAPIAAAAKAEKDTALSEKLTDMKAWVDSAAVALSTKTPAPAADSAASPDSSAVVQEPEVKPQAESPAKFKNGAPAPDTATPLPLLLLVGAGLVAAGSWIRRR